MQQFSIPFFARVCEDVIERVLRVLKVMIASGPSQTAPYRGALSAGADTKAQVIQRRTDASGKLHNHPSGDPKPSAADVAITREIVAATGAVHVKVHDHLVIGRNGAESFKSLGLL
jgi:hypothetical protein